MTVSTEPPVDRRWPEYVPLLLIALVVTMLLIKIAGFARVALHAVQMPYQLDYGEGIVWQQMRFIAAGRGYGPIAGFPSIIFHYPPTYHLITNMLALTTGADELLAGRAVSFGSMVIAAGLIAQVLALLAPPDIARFPKVIGCIAAGSIFVVMRQVEIWSLLMRVDMLCIALSWGALYCGMLALTRPRMVYLAAVLFVAAIYTKQTAVAPPTAVFAVLLFLRGRTALAGVACALSLGLSLLGILMLCTDGGFLRHIVYYNINRLDLRTLAEIIINFKIHFAFIVCAGLGIIRTVGHLRKTYCALATSSLRERLLACPVDARRVMALTYFATATPMLGLLTKSGASNNYLIEWNSIIALFAGVTLLDVTARATRSTANGALEPLDVGLPVAILLQLAATPSTTIWSAGELDQLAAREVVLVDMIRAAPGPVISDDMVALLRGGKTVLWEPAIFAELASKGTWNERPLIERIRERQFSFFVTSGRPGTAVFDSRYTPTIQLAMRQNYPVVIPLAGYDLHFPPAPLPAYARAILGRNR